MTEKTCLFYYDQLRMAHKYIGVMGAEELPVELANALSAVDAVLYLAEAAFVNYPHRDFIKQLAESNGYKK